MKVALLTILAIVVIVGIYENLNAAFDEKHKYDIIYARETHKENLGNLTDSEQGEFRMCMAMNKLKEYKRANFNVYFHLKGGTTEVDSILVHKTGIYIFESKFYEGKTVGGWDDENWYQKVPFKKTREFYNPIKQNRGHVRAVKAFMLKRGFPECPVYSIVAFADQTKVKQQKKEEENTYICKYSDIKQIITSITIKTDPNCFLKEDQINRYHWAFDTLSHVSQEVKDNHVTEANRLFLLSSLNLSEKGLHDTTVFCMFNNLGNILFTAP